MYFSANVGGANHLYRQRFPDGDPAQLTSSPATEERGIAMAPDGRSLITSVGQSLGSLWIRDSRGERLLPLDGSADSPRVSRDGSRVYCLVQRVGDPAYFGITVVDLASGKSDRILSEFSIADFDISRDDQLVAFTVTPKPQKREIWLAALDRRSPPRKVASDGDQVHFGRGNELVYRSLTGTANVLMRIATDGGGGAVRISDLPIIELGEVSPDGDWAMVAAPSPDGTSGPRTFAIQVHGQSVRQVCPGFCPISWLPDGHAYMPVLDESGATRVIRYQMQPGQVVPDVTSDIAEGSHGTPPLFWDSVAAGPDPSMFVFTRAQQGGNLFRVPLR
jgi:Tol biopolymer transport system component